MNAIEKLLDYMWDTEQQDWEAAAGEEYDQGTFTYDIVPNHIFNTLVQIKRSNLCATGYFVHDEALETNLVIGFGDDAAQSAEGIEADMGCFSEGEYVARDDGKTLIDWLGLGEV